MNTPNHECKLAWAPSPGIWSPVWVGRPHPSPPVPSLHPHAQAERPAHANHPGPRLLGQLECGEAWRRLRNLLDLRALFLGLTKEVSGAERAVPLQSQTLTEGPWATSHVSQQLDWTP